MTTVNAMKWPAHTFDWFAELDANNNKDWYDANKAAYAEIEAASTEFYEAIAAEHGGSVKVFRLRRDARFSKGQPPYKTEQKAGVMLDNGIVWSTDIGVDGVTVYAGHPMWDKQQLAQGRAAMSDPLLAAGLVQALADAAVSGFSLDAPELKKPLKDLPADHPNPELTRHKHLHVSRFHKGAKWLTRKGAGERLVDEWASIAPFTDWIAANVDPAEM